MFRQQQILDMTVNHNTYGEMKRVSWTAIYQAYNLGLYWRKTGNEVSV